MSPAFATLCPDAPRVGLWYVLEEMESLCWRLIMCDCG